MRLLLAATLGLLVLLAANASRGDDPKPGKENKRVKALFEAMQSGKYQEDEFPQLDMSDVPALLEYADHTEVLKTFPRNDISSQLQPRCSEGMVALWLIEGVRRGGKFPSLNSLCLRVGTRAGDWTEESEKNHAAVAKAYRDWWDKAKLLTPEKARAMDPLEDTGLAWH